MDLDTHQDDSGRRARATAGPTRTTGRGRLGARGVTVVAAALALSGCFGGGGPEAGPSAASSPGQVASTSPTRATFSLSVGLQPTHLTETVVLKLDGQQLADWTTDAKNPSRIITLADVSTGDVRYELSGAYTMYDAKGILQEKPVTGSGTIAIQDGGFYGIYYDTAKDVFELQRLR